MRIIPLFAIFGLCLGAQTPATQPVRSPAELQIAAARHVLESGPKTARMYDELALGLLRRSRETGDPVYLDEAGKAIDESLKLAPAGFDAGKLQAVLMLRRHEAKAALDLATQLNRKVPDDIAAWGLLADASAATGDYNAAEKAAQWMLDLRPGNTPAFIAAAQLREVFGDAEGAIDFFNEAQRRSPPNEVEERAWLLTRSASLYLKDGNPRKAAEALDGAMALFPGYHLALKVQGMLRTSEKKFSEASALFERRYQATHSADALFDLIRALEQSGRGKEAAALFAEFEKLALAEKENAQLVVFEADHGRAKEALKLAVAESADRRDIATLDAHAWALYRNRNPELAREFSDKAMAVGTREPLILCHASRIAAALGDKKPVAANQTSFELIPGGCPQ